MNKEFSYSYFKASISKIFTNTSLHSFLICIEYLPIFCASINSLPKMMNYQKPYTINNKNEVVNLDLISPFSQLRQMLIGRETCKGTVCFYSMKISFSIIILLILFEVFRVFLCKRSCKKNTKTCHTIRNVIDCCLINFYDIVFFRYFSIFFLDILFNSFLSVFSSENTGLDIIVSVLSFFAFVIMIYFLFVHLNTFSVWIQMSKNHTSEPKQNKNNPYLFYPFDKIFSSSYEIYLVLAKIIICIETTLLEKSQYIENIIFFLNASLVGIVLYKSLDIVYMILIKKDTFPFSFNKVTNTVRMVALGFNLLTIAFSPFFLDGKARTGLVVFILPLLIIISLLLMIIYSIIISKSRYRGNDNISNMFYLLNEEGITQEGIRLILIWHSLSCSTLNRCNICRIVSEKQQVDFVSLFTFFYKNEKKKLLSNQNKCHIDLLKIIYLHLKNNYFKLFSHFHQCLKIYQNKNKSLMINIMYLFEIFASHSSDEHDENLVKGLLESQSLCREIDNFLVKFKDFIHEDNSLRFPEDFISIAKNLNILKRKFYNSYQVSEMQEERENINFNLMKYNMLIERFLLENLFNRKFAKYKSLDIEQYEECLNYNYKSNKMLQLVITFSEKSGSRKIGCHARNNYNCSIIITACGGDLIHFKNKKFGELFPKDFQQEGIRKFLESLNNYKNNVIHNRNMNVCNENIFDFIILKEKYIQHFKYQFSMMPFLFDNSVIIQGNYLIDNGNLIIFKESIQDSDHAKISLHSVGETMSKILLIQPSWIELGEQKGKRLLLTQIFQCETLKEGKYTLDYQIYLKIYNKYIASIKGEFLSKAENEKNEINFLLEKAHLFSNVKLNIKISKIFDINIHHETERTDIKYQVFALKNYSKVLKILNKYLSFSKEAYIHESDNDAIWQSNQNFFLNSQGNTLLTGTSQSNNISDDKYDKKNNLVESSVGKDSNMSLLFTDKDKEFIIANTKYEISKSLIKNKMSSIKRKFHLCTWTIIGLNLLIIIISLIFFIIQSNQNSQFTRLNTIFSDFKLMRNFFTHSTLNLLAISYIGDFHSPVGRNNFVEYSQKIGEVGSIPPKLDVFTFLFRELDQKMIFTKIKVDSFNQDLFHYNDPKLMELFLTTMKYVEIIKTPNSTAVLSVLKFEITFKECMERFLNSFSVIMNSKQGLESSQIYIITMNGSNTIQFDNIYDQNINPVQKEFYSIVINFDRFIRMFQDCESAFQAEFEKLKASNELILTIFTITVSFMNMIVLICCSLYLLLAENQIKLSIHNMLWKVSEAGFILYYTSKLENLITLCRLYEANPTELIHKIDQKKKDYQAKIRSVNSIKNKKTKITTDTEAIDCTTKSLDNKEWYKQELITRIIKKYFFLLGICYALYFVIVIIFNLAILDKSFYVKQVFKYSEYNSEYENCIFSSLNLIQIMILTNRTDFELTQRITRVAKSVGYVENQITSAYKSIQQISEIERDYPEKFKRIERTVNYTCNSMSMAFNDSITLGVNKKFNLNYFEMLPKLCNQMDITHTNSFELLLYQMNVLTHKQLTRLDQRDYKSLADLSHSFELFQLYLMIILLFRPIRTYMRNNLFLNEVNSILSDYSITVAIYFGLNILTELIIFIVIQYAIIQNLKKVIQDLLVLDDCLHF